MASGDKSELETFVKARDAAAKEYATVKGTNFVASRDQRCFARGADWGYERGKRDLYYEVANQVTDLGTRVGYAEALLAEAKEVISFYANQNNYHWSSKRLPCGCCSTPVFPKMEADNEGDKARAFLEKLESKGISDFAKVEKPGEVNNSTATE